MFSFSKIQYLFSKEENMKILNSVRSNEAKTSGEIRIFIESKCTYVNPMMRAQELFHAYGMYKTEDRNAVLIYIAYKHKDFALYCDKEIFAKTTQSFWTEESKKLALGFYQKNYCACLIDCINNIGTQMALHFPFDGENKNELPDEIIFGK